LPITANMNFEMVLATNNPHKLEEVRQILAPHGIVVYGLKDLNIQPEDVEENGKTYFENALIKALSVKKLTNLPIISDDSGLEIEALDNQPGLHSARFAQKYNGHQNAITEILKQLENKDRKATFVCSITLLNVEDKPLRFESRIPGKIALEPQGETGFGYDPIFVEESSQLTYAEMTQELKNKLSHRGKALNKLLTYLKINQLIKR
jgi:XTP/dITP diphosphohydrolase